MTREELARVLELQSKAHEALVWLDLRSLSRPEMLTAETVSRLQNPKKCVAWVMQQWRSFPQSMRPGADELESFARLFASFFQVSYRVEKRYYDGKPYFRLMPNKDKALLRAPLSARRRASPGLRRKRRREAGGLAFDSALSLVSEQRSEELDEAVGEAIEQNRDDAILWAYACELHLREQGRSHGPAVHELWRQLDPQLRKHLTAEQVWNARERLQQAIRVRIADGDSREDEDETGANAVGTTC